MRKIILPLFLVLFTTFCSVAKANSQSFFMLTYTAASSGTTGVDTLTSGTVSNAANLTINLSSWYNSYTSIFIILYNVVPATNNTNLEMLVSSNGSSFDNSAAQYQWTFLYSIAGGATGNGGSASDADITLGQAIGNTTGYNSQFGILMAGQGLSSYYPVFTSTVTYLNNSGDVVTANGSSARLNAQATEAVRFLMSSGNISASYKVVGIR